eukprot:6226305-Alexandrium_andersonii.AAC.1
MCIRDRPRTVAPRPLLVHHPASRAVCPSPCEDRPTAAVSAAETRASCAARPLPFLCLLGPGCGRCRVGGGAFARRAPGAL